MSHRNPQQVCGLKGGAWGHVPHLSDTRSWSGKQPADDPTCEAASKRSPGAASRSEGKAGSSQGFFGFLGFWFLCVLGFWIFGCFVCFGSLGFFFGGGGGFCVCL